MDHLLRPGMRLLRRFTVAGKFVAIAVVLLVPLTILAGGSITGTANQVRGIATERRGLAVARPLALLTVDLHQWRMAEVTDQDRTDLSTALRAMDDVQPGTLDALGLSAEWHRLRSQVTALSAAGDGTAGEATIAVARDAVALLDRVANTSQLIYDAQLDSSYLALAVVDRIPALLEAAASAAENLPAGRPTPGEASAMTRQIMTPVRRLTTDLGSAVANSEWEALDSRLRDAVGSLQVSLTQFGSAVTIGRSALDTDADPGRSLTASSSELVGVLAEAIDHLLTERGRRLALRSAVPLLLAGSAVIVAAYLFGALARATSRDARQVLAEINSLTTGALHQTRPLDGSDEFAQMSLAAVVARDHLTSLLGTLRYQSTHDELTALANRALFTDKLDEALAEQGQHLAVVVIDLNGFKDVNDSFGHVIGDRLLRSLGARFHRAARRRDLVARLGADQFGLLILDVADAPQAAELATGLKTVLEQPVDVDGRLLRVQVSVGVAVTPDGGSTATDLLRNADVAMHAAKTAGAGARSLAIFQPAMHEATRLRTELSFELVQAVEHQQLTVVYQPIIDLATQTVYGVEALVRWEHPTRGLISPTVFVPLAEATGLIVPMGRWVMREAVAQLAGWHAEFPDAHPLTMDINLSTDQLNDSGLVEDVLSLISETGIDAQSIVLEITESAVVREFDTALRRLSQLSAMGLRLALDDFGTGYSSLSYLGRLPVTVLKIDKSFVRALHDGSGQPGLVPGADEVLLSGIVALGTRLGMQIVAEGIETPDQASRLREAGCQLGQGYLWSRPLTADDLRAVLRRGGRVHHLPRPRNAELSH